VYSLENASKSLIPHARQAGIFMLPGEAAASSLTAVPGLVSGLPVGARGVGSVSRNQRLSVRPRFDRFDVYRPSDDVAIITLCETSLAPTRARSLCTCGSLRARVAECTHRDRDKDDGGC